MRVSPAMLMVPLVAVVLVACGGGESDAAKVARFRDLAGERDLRIGGLTTDAKVVEYADRVCDDLDAQGEAFFLATVSDTNGDVTEAAGLHATAVDAFCPGERDDLEEGVASFESSSGQDVDLPEAP